MANKEHVFARSQLELYPIEDSICGGITCIIQNFDSSTFAVIISAKDYELLCMAKERGVNSIGAQSICSGD